MLQVGVKTPSNYLGQRLSEAEWGEERKKRFYMTSVIRVCISLIYGKNILSYWREAKIVKRKSIPRQVFVNFEKTQNKGGTLKASTTLIINK